MDCGVLVNHQNAKRCPPCSEGKRMENNLSYKRRYNKKPKPINYFEDK